jgi:hypothetical protein
VLDSDSFEHIWRLIIAYLEREMQIKYCAVLSKGTVAGRRGLQTLLYIHDSQRNISFPIRKDDESFYNPAAFAFENNMRLWLVAPDEVPLKDTLQINDEWTHSGDQLPGFDQAMDMNIRTAIFMPLCRDGEPFAIADLQSELYQCPTDIALRELEMLAEVLTQMLLLHEMNVMRHARTEEAMKLLRRPLDEKSYRPVTAPQIFFAFSASARDDVVGLIKDVLHEYSGRLSVYFWDESQQSGDITEELMTRIAGSRFGLCYFSEPSCSPAGEQPFRDNPNVIFEAGMFQSLTNTAPTDEPRG